jgi:arylsulfatase A
MYGNRSEYCMYRLFLFLLFVCFSSIFGAKKPNVIVILTDDQGTLDTKYLGAKDLLTPNLDRLASNGLKMTQFYSSAPVCSPSRASLLTGLSPQAAGVPGNVGTSSEGMPSSRVTIAEVLKDAGYKTAQIGKWHLGHHDDTVPNAQGFDYQFGHLVGCIDNYSHFFYWNGPNRHDLYRNNKEVFYPGKFFPDMMVDEAEQFMRASKDNPFFIYFAINLPHYPYQGDPEWLEYYKDLPMPRRSYAAFISTMDARIGRLLDAVKNLGLEKETIIIFQSDHGHSTEERAFGGGGFAGPYRGAKFSLLEGGLRVPAVISWPGTLPEGEERRQFAVSPDWFPTILDLCGVAQPVHTLEGKSLVPLLMDNKQKSSHQHFNWEMSGQWAVREGDWKLCNNVYDTTNMKRVLEKGSKLYNLAEDPSELKDLANENKDVVTRLTAIHEAWVKSLSKD